MPDDTRAMPAPLGNAVYRGPAAAEAADDALLRRGWAALAAASEVPEPGDALPVTFLGVPLLLLRGRDGTVRVFQNVCRHRGMILVGAPARFRGAIRCPYHSWCYDTDGRLRATPHVGGPGRNACEGIDRSELGLIEVRSGLWRDIVFVDLAGGAGPFEDHVAPLAARWAEFEGAPLHRAGGFVLTARGDWKLAVENYCESYHLPWVHPALNAYSRLEDHYGIEDDAMSGQGTHVYRQLEVGGARLPDFPGLSARWDRAAEYVALFPNVLFGVHRDHAFAIVLRPAREGGARATEEHVHLYYPQPPDPALHAANLAQWRLVFEEDLPVVEGMQKGRACPGFDGGRLSPVMEGPTAAFHAWARARL
ncbi:MAG: aromatic ring-hydroxylating oxygenase subunit alpha [Hasllibacter sp.]